MVVSILIGCYVNHAHCPSNVASVIVGIANLHTPVQSKKIVYIYMAQFTSDGHGTVIRTNRQVCIFTLPVGWYMYL